jgi:hypothetical protein
MRTIIMVLSGIREKASGSVIRVSGTVCSTLSDT